MARDDADKKRLADRKRTESREREDERDREEELAKRVSGKIGVRAPTSLTSDEVEKMMGQARALIDQVSALYNQYLGGIEKLPPIEKRKQLEQLMTTLSVSRGGPASLQFKLSGLTASYATFRDHWDKQMRNLEAGKIKRQS